MLRGIPQARGGIATVINWSVDQPHAPFLQIFGRKFLQQSIEAIDRLSWLLPRIREGGKKRRKKSILRKPAAAP